MSSCRITSKDAKVDQFDDDFDDELISFLGENVYQLETSSSADITLKRKATTSATDDGFFSDDVTLCTDTLCPKAVELTTQLSKQACYSCNSPSTAKIKDAVILPKFDSHMSPELSHPVAWNQNRSAAPSSAVCTLFNEGPRAMSSPLAASTPQQPASSGRANALWGWDGQPPPATPPVGRSSAIDHDTPRKRQFPGPAGLLPKLVHFDATSLNVSAANYPHEADGGAQQDSMLSSQCDTGLYSFAAPLWQRMMRDLEIQEEELRKHSIRIVKQLALRKKLSGGKVPFLAAVIESINLAVGDASIVLKDPTGEMQGTMLKQLLKEHPNQLRPGSLLVLKQVAVFSPSPRRQYLNVTPNNLLCVYNEDSCSNFLPCKASRDFLGNTKDVVRQALTAVAEPVPLLRLSRPAQARPSPVTPVAAVRGLVAGSRRLCSASSPLTSAAASYKNGISTAVIQGCNRLAAPSATFTGTTRLPVQQQSLPCNPVHLAGGHQRTEIAGSGGAVRAAMSCAARTLPQHSNRLTPAWPLDTENLWQDSDWDELDLELP